MGTTTESKLRRIIREELDYYFDRLEKTLLESKSGTTVRETISKSSNTLSSSTDDERQKFRKKFGGLMGKITEDMDTTNFEETSNSILDNNVLESLGNSTKTQAVHKALTKDYSALLKKMNK